MEGPGGGGAAVVYPNWFQHYLRTITGDGIQGVDESFKQQLTNDFMEETNIEKKLFRNSYRSRSWKPPPLRCPGTILKKTKSRLPVGQLKV